MKFEPFVALRYLRSPRSDKSISVITLISVVGVALGVAALIVVLSVMNGFERDLRSALMGVNAHLTVGKFNVSGQLPLESNTEITEQIRAAVPFKSVTPYTLNQALVNSDVTPKGILVRGIIPEEELKYPLLSRYFFFTQEDRAKGMTPKQTEDLLLSLKPQETVVYKYTEPVNPSPDAGSSPAGGHLDDKELISADGDAVQEIKTPETETVMLPGIILGRSLADELSVSTGDVIEVISLRERISPLGGLPHIKRFQVRGIFISGLSGYDETLAFTDLETAQKFFFRSKAVSGISVFLDNPDDAVKYQEKLQETFTFPYYVRSWIEDNANLFAVIALEKVGLSVILTLIILIASFNIIASLIILVIEKKKDIAVLKTMGATDGSVRRIFILQGTVIGLSGTIIGEIAGLLICLVIKNYEVVKIPEGVYVANKIPLYINGLHLLLIGVVSMIICFAVTVYPSTKAARYAPAENLRND